MIALALVFLICAAPLVVGYRLVTGNATVAGARVTSGIVLLVLGGALASWLLTNVSFGAGF